MDTIIDIKEYGYKDPVSVEIEGYSPGNNTGAPRYRIDKDGVLYLYISSSLIKKFIHRTEVKQYCPRQLFETVITSHYDFPQTLSMLKGSYFETQAIGCGAGGLKTIELPRQKNGNPYVYEKRIDEQVATFNHLYPKKGIIIDSPNNTQVRNMKQWKDVTYLDLVVYITGEADIITPYNELGRIIDSIIVDLKLTLDLTSRFGPYGWGSLINYNGYSDVDTIQATIYHLLFNMPFAYWIFDYKASKRENEFFFVNHNTKHENPRLAAKAKQRLYDLRETINKTINEIVFNFRTGWKPNPENADCSKCPVLSCEHKDKLLREI